MSLLKEVNLYSFSHDWIFIILDYQDKKWNNLVSRSFTIGWDAINLVSLVASLIISWKGQADLSATSQDKFISFYELAISQTHYRGLMSFSLFHYLLEYGKYKLSSKYYFLPSTGIRISKWYRDGKKTKNHSLSTNKIEWPFDGICIILLFGVTHF